ncbi:hypothetical protein D3C87_1706470 [compost metagenome]
MDLLDEVLEHGLGHVEVGDDAVHQGPDGDDVAGGTAQHLLGLLADRERCAAVALLDGDHRGLAQHDPIAPHEHQGIGGAKIDAHVAAEAAEEIVEHG